MPTQPRKLTFEEVIKTSLAFYNNEELEQRFDKFVRERTNEIITHDRAIEESGVNIDNVVRFLRDEPNGLIRILNKIHLSQEKFKRIITLLRKLDGTFDREWNVDKIMREIREEDDFAERIANLFINGRNDPQLIRHLPLFYRERLNLTKLTEVGTEEELRIKLKDKCMGQYSNWKGDLVEGLIRAKLERIEKEHGISHSAGITSFVDVTVDWAIPNLTDPYVIIMSSYQETTSSGQSTKARDMIKCYEAIQHLNLQRGENRAFVNFVDGAGWLARQSDLRRLVDGCHYFLNINTLDMLEGIILNHVPKKYFRGKQTSLM